MSDENAVIFKAGDMLPVIQEARNNQCPILLVKDGGLYLMSENGESDPKTGRRKVVAYAGGFNPDINEFDEWYDRLRAICGGDDFAETISPDEPVIQRIENNHLSLRVEFTPTMFRLIAVKS